MGYWNHGADGTSLHREKTGLVWGDAPADIVDDAIQAVVVKFHEDMDRFPSVEEIRAGFAFSLNALEGLEFLR